MTTTHNIKLTQGEDHEFNVALTQNKQPVPLQSALDLQARLQIRPSASDPTLVANLEYPTHLTTQGDQLRVRIPGSATRTLRPGLYVYDLFLRAHGRTHVPVKGRIEIQDAVTETGDWT